MKKPALIPFLIAALLLLQGCVCNTIITDDLCETDEECTDESAPYCNSESGRCVICFENSHCPEDQVCVGHVCVDEEGETCISSEDCLYKWAPYCNLESGICVMCLENSHCLEDKVCVGHVCVDEEGEICISNEDCPYESAPYCNLESGICVMCLEKSHCLEDQECVGHICVDEEGEICISNADCPYESAPYCKLESGICVMCLENSHCLENQVCVGHVCVDEEVSPTVINDFTGDGRTDLVLYHPVSGEWRIESVEGTEILSVDRWGGVGMVPVFGDYNGDGKTDLAVYSLKTGNWSIRTADGIELASDINSGVSDAVPVPGDYDGDGVYDLAVFQPRTGSWFIRKLDGTTVAWDVKVEGTPGAVWVPVPGDYDGDGISDLAVYSIGGQWNISRTDGTEILVEPDWGAGGMVPVSGDYNGNGISDLALFHRGNWYIRSVAGEIIAWEMNFGAHWMLPTSGDYNGDGRADPTVFNTYTGNWHSISLTADPGVILDAHPGSTEGFVSAGSPDARISWGGMAIERVTAGYRIGTEHAVSPTPYTRKASIYTDLLDQPHILTEWSHNNRNNGIYAYRMIHGRWYSQEPLLAGPYEIPNIRIDNRDRAWISTSVVCNGGDFCRNNFVGLGGRKCCNQLHLFDRVSTSATYNPPLLWGPVNIDSGFVGVMDIDPAHPDHAIHLGDWFAHFDMHGNVVRGPDPVLHAGEKMAMRIAPRPGETGVWHAASGGYYRHYSQYRNSLFDAATPNVIWAGEPYMEEAGNDRSYISVGTDGLRPDVAYMVGAYGGVSINIWNGTGMVFDVNNLYKVENQAARYGNAANSNGRCPPQWSPARDGGAYLCWTAQTHEGHRIRLRRFHHSGPESFGPMIEIGPGSRCTLTTDSRGALHLGYENNGVRYRIIVPPHNP